MKFRITMKDPDGVYDCVQDAIKASRPGGLNDREWESLREARSETFSEITSRWFEYDEYLTVEIDTDAKTCVVVERGR